VNTLGGLTGFIEQPRPAFPEEFTAVSVFSGAGLSDIGYALAGFRFIVQVELDPRRAEVGSANFPGSRWLVGDVRQLQADIVTAYRAATNDKLDLLVATPPCQGMSSSNPSRGRRHTAEAERLEDKNQLLLEVVPLAKELQPRLIVAENVRPLLTLQVTYEGRHASVLDHLRACLPNYEFFAGVINVADYGVPEDRRRALMVGVHRDELWLKDVVDQGFVPWPAPTHAEQTMDGLQPWVSLGEWLRFMNYEPLDSSSPEAAKGTPPLHFVPHYAGDRYLLVSHIPPNSGKSAYENDTCPVCGTHPVRPGVVKCPYGHLMRNRPYVRQGRSVRLIKGFDSSYRRMDPKRPSYTITTNSSHIGSDFKIHPWENRVLSILECADLQSVPRFFDWSATLERKSGGKPVPYLVRNLVGEAFPPYFTYLHGEVLRCLLVGDLGVFAELAQMERPRPSRCKSFSSLPLAS
jgi:DNA (cytosine-5)-methyltransferase 1